jgi:hypothetical protein
VFPGPKFPFVHKEFVVERSVWGRVMFSEGYARKLPAESPVEGGKAVFMPQPLGFREWDFR